MPPKVLFICLGNSCRSIMAEALARHLFGESWAAASAGLSPMGLVAPETLAALAEIGVNTAGLRSKGMEEFDLSQFRLLVNLTQHSLAGRLPPAEALRVLHCPVPDPYGGSPADYRRSRDTIMQLIFRELGRQANLE
jgi:protein-tyrosine-phosphatase